MAKTQAEIQKAYRKRKKANLEHSVDESLQYIRNPVSDYLSEWGFDFEGSLDHWGVELDTAKWGAAVQTFATGAGERTVSALERLEGLASSFKDAAQELHIFINEYKIAEATKHRAELLSAKYETPDAQRAAFEQIAKIEAVITSLSRERRLMLPVFRTNVA